MPHTPGPWCVESATSEAYHDVALAYETPGQGHPIVIASMHFDDNDYPRQLVTRSQATANARLMAAAPDLLAACKMGLTRLRMNDRFPDIALVIEAAIAKAEGATDAPQP